MRILTSILIISAILITYALVTALQEAPDGSVCFDNCNGHGDCVDYVCKCHIGYHGDDCKETYVTDVDNIVPILGAGHFNVSRKDFMETVNKHSMILVGFSSRNCHKCIQVEPHYKNVSDYLKTVKIPFARANIDEMKSLAADYEAQDIPSLVFFKKRRGYLYKGFHDADSVITYIKKQTSSPVTSLKTSAAVENYLSSFIGNKTLSLHTVVVVGFFSSHLGIEEDEYEDFIDIAKELQSKEDVYFGVVTNAAVSKEYKAKKIIDRTPSLLLQRDKNTRFTINMDEFIGEDYGIKGWIERKSIPLVGKLTPESFRLYEKLNLPMALLFLDLTHEDRVSTNLTDTHVVGGKSGGILNEMLLEEYRKVAAEYGDRVSFVYLDGVSHQDQMRSLGIYGGAEGLPSLGFNTKDGRQAPFPNELPINYDTMNRYCAEFLSGKLRNTKDSLEFVKKELQSVTPINPKNTAVRKAPKRAPEPEQGVSEQYGDGRPGDDAILQVTAENFTEIVLNDDKDVVMVFYSVGCESCAHFAVYYKRMAMRFKELGYPSLVIGRMDVTEDSPPPELNIIVSKLPLFMVFPAGAKHPPWSYYSGISKIQPMMYWVAEQVSIKFTLPHLPHLNEEQRKLYREQIREREEYMEEKRFRENQEMEEEDRKREESEQRRLARLNRVDQQIQNMIDETDMEF